VAPDCGNGVKAVSDLEGRPDGREEANDPRGTALLSDPSVPNVARIYNYWLGGKDNYAADRRVADKILEIAPDARAIARENREFLQRAVRFLAGEAGIRQFIDIGTGLPSQGNVHEVAQGISEDARVVYVDYDPVVISHAQALLADEKTVTAIRGDLRHPSDILSHPNLRKFIDFSQPVAVLLIAVLHFLGNSEDPYGNAGHLMNAVPPGSYLVISHATADFAAGEVSAEVQSIYEGATAPITPRTHAEVAGFFKAAGLELVEPGVVGIGDWRREWGRRPGRTIVYGGAGKKP
jgi:hypothetical protein